uniref:Formamidopyrimidine-DNA glycosylase n=1 Tax=uncultured Alphaproteobacteria bacterium TaxID=91750 RepID=A0A6M4NNC7_9PROT|nr:formamidopyrimidine-DNA glycosylase [uncultured Alphaproteobacteria bacterium]
MPELPEVETVKNGIAGFIGQAKILRVEIRNRHFRDIIPEDTESKITGASILGYRRIGKYIIIDLDNGLCLIWHLGMSGRIKTFKSLPDQQEKHDHILIETSTGWLIYNDPRRFGLLVYARQEDLFRTKYLCNMGIDPFDDRLDTTYLAEKLKNKKIPIKEALLNQNIINGIGNIYASEILYASRISPLRASDSLSKEECTAVIENTKKILQKAINNGGSTLKDYHKPDGSLGYFQYMHCVYNKTGQRCPDCKCDITKTGGIKKSVQAGRSTFYCPTLQK